MLEELKDIVCNANRELFKRGIVIYTWGNVSAMDRNLGLVVIKPSGISYETMCASDMVVVDLNGVVIDGKWRPSSDLRTHIELYKACDDIGGIAHAHSVNCVAFSQAGMEITPLGTTHADYFHGAVPCTRSLTEEEVADDYERNTGKAILETIDVSDPLAVPACLVKIHGPFVWGKDADEAVHNAVVLETVAEMNFKSLMLCKSSALEQYMLEKHYTRKHGKDAYYGQNEKTVYQVVKGENNRDDANKTTK